MTPVKDPAESIVIDFDFSGELASVDTAVIAVSIVGDGIDAGIASMLDGAPQISGAHVLQRVGNGVDGVNYKLRCEATLGADVIVRANVMPVRIA